MATAANPCMLRPPAANTGHGLPAGGLARYVCPWKRTGTGTEWSKSRRQHRRFPLPAGFLTINFFKIMGSFRKGIQGGFSGKVGNVVGAHWRGIDYMRSLPRVSKGRVVTEDQLVHRVRFACAVNFAKPISFVFNAGYGKLAKQNLSGYNLAVRQIFKQAIVGEYPDFEVDPALVRISEGDLVRPRNPMVEVLSGQLLRFTWADHTRRGIKADHSDRAIVVVYNPAKAEYQYDTQGAERLDEELLLELPDYFAGDEVHVYLGMVSKTGGNACNSLYLGTVTVDGGEASAPEPEEEDEP
ncbi:hypothetical protein JHJ32_06895 [Parapedobacter sp. ISTM3]|nr:MULTISPECIES: DUF6266 family protein [Parapedobacter]MBK1439703.1 hypothetical protein [Parapedobacter sp. ISTM3]